jgi:hypothetical protein
MSQKAVEQALGKLVTDEGFRERYFRDPGGAAVQAGLELSAAEIEALAQAPRRLLGALGRRLDDRICRLSLAADPAAAEDRG